MSDPACGAIHPLNTDRTCIKRGADHADHADPEGIWPNETVIEQVRERAEFRKAKKRRGGARALAKKARDGKRAILAGDSGPGLDPEILVRWQADEWQAYAGPIVESFLRRHEGEFTTAEDIWPLLDRPEEMRSMSVLVQAFLRAHYIEEVAAKRLRGTYRTKDGFEFAENKLVPIYRSLIVEVQPRWGT